MPVTGDIHNNNNNKKKKKKKKRRRLANLVDTSFSINHKIRRVKHSVGAAYFVWPYFWVTIEVMLSDKRSWIRYGRYDNPKVSDIPT